MTLPPRRKKPVRWTIHALEETERRELNVDEVLAAVYEPESVEPVDFGRLAHLKRYHDRIDGKTMLMRVIIEETDDQLVIVTAHRTSKIARYLKGLN